MNLQIDESIFRAYDIRGRYPDELNVKTAHLVAEVLAKKIAGSARPFILVGHDARVSSPALYHSFIKGLEHTLGKRVRIISAGLITTPMMYFLANYFGADLGVAITASHSPKDYNGIKVVGADNNPISGKQILKALHQLK
ncbi:MAG: hypothetical protein HYS87_01015 [Candidatus Colwellbacteria bacterium]|nr:hypothetical protein [Candidatus Colwellbacteria bacterium]